LADKLRTKVKDRDKIKEQLIHELVKTRREISDLKAWEVKHKRAEAALTNYIQRLEETVAELRNQALVDELTGLYNRRGFMLLTQQQLKLANRTKMGMLLLFADLDNLKWINDTFGHPEGDLALIETANILKKTFREPDIIARIGGDEFGVLAIESRKDSGEVLVNRLQKRLDINNAKRKRCYKLSLSTGIERYNPECPCSIDELLAVADSLMYEQKRKRLTTVRQVSKPLGSKGLSIVLRSSSTTEKG
jgi:diguanylate cyclase (GGDEF)-like protein